METKNNIADRAYERAKKEYDAEFKAAEADYWERLKDPGYARSLGLPEALPESTIQILKFTITLDKVGPKLPKKKEFYEKYGA